MRYSGKIGFIKDEETAPGVWMPSVLTEKQYFGDVLQNSRRWDQPTEVNDHLNLTNKISIVADSYILENIAYMRYATWMGTKWKISSVDVSRPRITLTLGGEYDE